MPPSATGVWIVAALLKDPANGFKDTLYYPKVRLDQPSEAFDVNIPANTESGTRNGRYLLVMATSLEADAELVQSRKSDETRDDQAYADENRVRLPVGSFEIARSEVAKQQC